MTFQFLLPLAVLISTYTRIAVAVWGKRPPGEAENSRDQRMARSKRKVGNNLCVIFIYISTNPLELSIFLNIIKT